MKLILLLLFSLFTGHLFAQSGILTFEKKEIHLAGLKADDTPTTVTFHVKNTGQQPVLISKVIPMFPRMHADWDKTPILPQKSTEIRISFTSQDLPEQFNYIINVNSNAQNPREQLRVSGNIIDNPEKPELLYKTDLSGVKFKTNNISFGKIFIQEIAKDTVYFYNTREKAVTVSTRYTPSHIKADVYPHTVQPGEKGMLILTYDAIAKNDYGYIFDSVILKFDDDNSYNNSLTVTDNIT